MPKTLQLEPIYNSSERTQDVVYRTRRKRWIIEMNGKRDSEKSVRAAHDDDDDDDGKSKFTVSL